MLLIDQLNREVQVKVPISTIVSLVPSHTELLFDLGLKRKLKGRTKFCIHPKSLVKSAEIIGGTKNIDFKKIDLINPDLIICNKEENNKEDVHQLAEKYPVWVSDIKSFEDSCEMIQHLAQLFDVHNTGARIIEQSKEAMHRLRRSTQIRAAYLIWQKPYMTIGSDTYIHYMLDRLGYTNVFSHLERYPIITPKDLLTCNPESLLLSSEPYPFAKKHIEEFQSFLPNTRIELVDGEVFSWHGSRIMHKKRI